MEVVRIRISKNDFPMMSDVKEFNQEVTLQNFDMFYNEESEVRNFEQIVFFCGKEEIKRGVETITPFVLVDETDNTITMQDGTPIIFLQFILK